jgi:hypothetical protein
MDLLRSVAELVLERKPVKSERDITKAETLQFIWAWID